MRRSLLSPHLRRSICRVAPALALALTAGLAGATPDTMMSHLAAHALVLPPVALTRPLADGDPQSKGMKPEVEHALLAALRGVGLTQRVLRVAVAAEGGLAVALVKVQAGDAHSRVFALGSLEDDAARVLQAAFDLRERLGHVDFWAVVPEIGGDGMEWHRPVFSVAAERGLYERITAGNAHSAREMLARLSAVRYDPVFTQYATDWAGARDNMPRTAYVFPRLADEWSAMAREGRNGAAGLVGHEARVGVILGGVPDGGKVALTIDDGPHPLITPLYLDILRRENVKATFFVVGEKCEEFPGLVREIAREGHELANHTYSHRRFSTLPPEEVYAEIRGCSRIVGALTGRVMRYMRPPGGDYTAASLEIADRLGMVTALWSHNAGDWTIRVPETVAFHATHQLTSGDIILMHQGELHSLQALPMIIARVRARGLEPARLADIVGDRPLPLTTAREALAQRGRLRLTE